MHGQPQRPADVDAGQAHDLHIDGRVAVSNPPPPTGHEGPSRAPIEDLLRAAARGHGDRPAVVDGSGAGYSYAGLLWAVEAGIEWFRSVGPQPPVLCVAGGTTGDVVAVLAGIASGCVPLVADCGWGGDVYARIAADTGAGMILTADPAAARPPAQSFSPWPDLRWADLTRTPLPAAAAFAPMDHSHGPIGRMVHRRESGAGAGRGAGAERGAGAGGGAGVGGGAGYGRFVPGGAGGPRCLRFTEQAAVAAGRAWRRHTGLAVADVVLCRVAPGGGPEFDTRLFGVLDARATLVLGAQEPGPAERDRAGRPEHR